MAYYIYYRCFPRSIYTYIKRSVSLRMNVSQTYNVYIYIYIYYTNIYTYIYIYIYIYIYKIYVQITNNIVICNFILYNLIKLLTNFVV